MSKSPITCHVLDSSTGKPAQNVEVQLQQHHALPDQTFVFNPIGHGVTDADGRCMSLLVGAAEKGIALEPGLYKVIFKTKPYFEATHRHCFYPWVEITFELVNTDDHYHIPLLISPFSFTTYRGS